MGSARRVVKAGKKAVKGMLSSQTDFITRTRAVKRLGISLKDFRRLCILKGIYPRPPPHNHARTATQAFYHVKDVSFLAHEPLLARFRDSKVFMKRVRRALGRSDVSSARRLYSDAPVLSLDHLIRERYPTFTQALGDADDALSLTALLETLPVGKALPATRIAAAGSRMREWYGYVAAAGGLKSVFLTIKGVYLTVSVAGVDVTWLAPHRFAAGDTSDVDMRVLMTYFDLYDSFLSFVLFKLYAGIGVAYPPPPAEDGAEDRVVDLKVPHATGSPTSSLFAGLTFALGRESPLRLLELCIAACGGRVAGDAADAGVTHVVWDRPGLPPAPGSREFVQPQWVADCVNARVLLPVAPYRPGVLPPPHLSPYVESTPGGHTPAYAAEMARARDAAAALRVDMKEPEEEEEGDSSAEEEEGNGPRSKKPRMAAAEKEAQADEMDEDAATPSATATAATPLAVAMLSSKNKRLYDRVTAARAHTKREADTLAEKAAKIAKAGTKRSRE